MEHTGFTNDNKTITKTITFGIKNGPCETLPFFPFSSPFPFLSPVSSFTLPFPSPFLLPFLLPFPLPFLFRFLFRSFSFRFPFLFLSFPFSFPFPFPFVSFFLSLSFSFPFPFPFLFLSLSYSVLFLPLLFLFLFPFLADVNSLIRVWSQRLEKRYEEKKPITSGKTIWKGSGFLQTFIYIQINTVYTYLHILILIRWAYIIWLVVWNGFYLSIYWECHPPSWRTPSFFRGVAQNHQPDIDLYSYRWCTY